MVFLHCWKTVRGKLPKVRGIRSGQIFRDRAQKGRGFGSFNGLFRCAEVCADFVVLLVHGKQV
jgi:hypothetical protein